MMDIERICREAGALKWAVLHPEEVSPEDVRRHYEHWLKRGNEGALSYIDERLAMLIDPFGVRPWAKSLLLIVFRPEKVLDSPLLRLPSPTENGVVGRIAGYALREDYHLAGRRILERIRVELSELGAQQSELCVDSSPVPEKYLAKVAGLGAGAPNSLVRVAGFGCRVYLGALFVDLELPSHHGSTEFAVDCASCLKCRRACPNHAMSEDGTLIVRACRSWMASEWRGGVTWAQQQALGGTLFGCSICSSCCPEDTLGDEDLLVDCLALLKMPTAELRRVIGGTTVEHAGPTLLKRNAAAAVGVQCGTPELQKELLAICNSPVVAETVREWKDGMAWL